MPNPALYSDGNAFAKGEAFDLELIVLENGTQNPGGDSLAKGSGREHNLGPTNKNCAINLAVKILEVDGDWRGNCCDRTVALSSDPLS